jgi:succinyl-CoA synthetase beta subunit
VKIHEYQAKELLAQYGIPVPRGRVVQTPAEASSAYEALGGALAVVKAQIHAGGRGKGGGVKLVRSAAEAASAAEAILSKPLVTHQTGPQGQRVKKLLVEEGTAIARELYAGVALDRALRKPVLMISAEGGVEIEEVAAKHPERILREPFTAALGLTGFQARRVCFALKLSKDEMKAAVPLLQNLCRAFLELDASIAEINPLVVTKDAKVLALDAKMNFDGNGLYRQTKVMTYRDRDEEDARESAASEHGLSWVSLDGNIGCMVNGAGLAMATMDSILLHGGRPANFLDVGGGATTQQVREAFKLILKDPQVRAILVNIFGGIAKCDVIADGVLQAAREVEMAVPLVVRLEGTNVEIGREKLRTSGLRLVTAATMDEAAKAVVALATGATPPASGKR